MHLLLHKASNLLAGSYESLDVFFHDLVEFLNRSGYRFSWWRSWFCGSRSSSSTSCCCHALSGTRTVDSGNRIGMGSVDRSRHILQSGGGSLEPVSYHCQPSVCLSGRYGDENLRSRHIDKRFKVKVVAAFV